MNTRDIDQQSRNPAKNPEKKQQENPFDDVPPCTDDPPYSLGEPPSASTPACGHGEPARTNKPGLEDFIANGESVSRIKDEPTEYLVFDGKKGIIPYEECGLLVGAGGAGKSYALLQLALAVAGNGKWLGWSVTPKTGKVLVLLAEETNKKIRRRLRNIANKNPCGIDCNKAYEDMKKIDFIGLARTGIDTQLFTKGYEEIITGRLYDEVKRRVTRERYDLIIFDPANSFGSDEFEKDPKHASKLAVLLYELMQPGSRTTIIVSHHTNKPARQAGTADQTAARGTTGITDAFRFAMHLGVKPRLAEDFDILDIRVTKNNEGMANASSALVRLDDNHGVIHSASDRMRHIEEYERLAAQADEEKKAKSKKRTTKSASPSNAEEPDPDEVSKPQTTANIRPKYKQAKLEVVHDIDKDIKETDETISKVMQEDEGE